MKFLFVFLNFLYFTCLAISAQDSKENIFNSIKENYQSKAFDCCILSSEGKWYFVTAVGNQKRSSFWSQLAGSKQMSLYDYAIKQKAREQVIKFFVGTSRKKYINYTRLPKNMENLEDLEAVYERLHKSEKYFYSMPLIGSAGTDIYFFAKAITDEAISQREDTQERTNSSSFNIAARDTNKPNSSSHDSLNSTNSKDKAPDTQASENKSVTLVVSGSGINKDEAIKNALRAALEQTYGTFVSSNTQLVNDELVKDEIISVSSGNIEKYSEVSSLLLEDGRYNITLNATVSIGKLVKFAQSKGASTELAGASFVMNMKIRKLEKENELAMLRHLYDKMIRISKLNLFDYNLKVHEPIVNSATNKYLVPLEIQIEPNDNYKNLIEEFKRTIGSLSLSKEEQDSYRNSGFKCYTIESDYDKVVVPDYFRSYYWNRFTKKRESFTIFGMNVDFPFALRNPLFNEHDNSCAWTRDYIDSLRNNILQSSISFSILDNLGNSTSPVKVKLSFSPSSSDYIYINTGCNIPIYTKVNSGKNYYKNFDLYGLTYSDNCTNNSFLPIDEARCDSYMSTYYNCLEYKERPQSYYKNGGVRSISDEKLRILDYSCRIFDHDSHLFKFSKHFLGLSDYAKNGAKYILHFDLIYSEDELSKINKIELLPINPDSIKTITKTINRE